MGGVQMIAEAAKMLTDFIHELGYVGVFVASFLESTFVPIPSAATMIPAGYLVQQGHWSLPITLFLALSGMLLGSLANYFIAYYMGRPLLARYGKYMFFGHDKMTLLDKYFADHGDISVFTARFVPGLRHVSSFPAGLAKMGLKKFTLLTSLGGGLWMTSLFIIGYTIGDNMALVQEYTHVITVACILGVAAIIGLYVWRIKSKMEKANAIVQ